MTVNRLSSVRYTHGDWFQAPTGQNQYEYSGICSGLNFAEKRGRWDWDAAELAVPFLLGLPDNATAPAPQGALGLGSNYYTANSNSQYSRNMAFPASSSTCDSRGLGGSARQFIANRQHVFEFNDGTGDRPPRTPRSATLKRDRVSQSALSAYFLRLVWMWAAVSTAAHYSYAAPKSDFTFVAATPTRGVFQTDGWGWNRVAFGYAAFTHEWGTGKHSADTRVFALDYDDWRHILKTDDRPTAVRRGDTENIHIQTFGAHSLHSFTTGGGTIDALAWGAGQTGRWGTQTLALPTLLQISDRAVFSPSFPVSSNRWRN